MEALSNMAPVNLHFNSLPLNQSYDPLRREILCQIALRQQRNASNNVHFFTFVCKCQKAGRRKHETGRKKSHCMKSVWGRPAIYLISETNVFFTSMPIHCSEKTLLVKSFSHELLTTRFLFLQGITRVCCWLLFKGHYNLVTPIFSNSDSLKVFSVDFCLIWRYLCGARAVALGRYQPLSCCKVGPL